MPAYFIILISVIGVIIFNILGLIMNFLKKHSLELHLVEIDTDPAPDTDPDRQALSTGSDLDPPK